MLFISFFPSFFIGIYVQIISTVFSLLNQDAVGGRGQKSEPGTHSTWPFWFRYQKTRRYASLWFSSPINNLPKSGLYPCPSGRSSPQFASRDVDKVPVWSFDIMSLFPLTHLPVLGGQVYLNSRGIHSTLVIPLCCSSV